MGKNKRNKPCHCGSGKKYKKCCISKDQKQKIPDEAIKYFQETLSRQAYLKQAGIHINYVKPIMFKGEKIFALGNKLYTNVNQNETFHSFIIQILKDTIGLDWFREQEKLPIKERHYISISLEKLGEWMEKNKETAERVNEKIWGAKPDGYSKSLLLLAFDVCSLIHTNKLPPSLIKRLKNREHYQGARYEIAIAGIFARLDCDIQFTDENSKNKHCEFIATHRETGAILAVEAKSKKRSGVLHEIGLLQPLEKLYSARVIKRLFKKALEQNPKDVPFAVFIDVNTPLTPNIPADNKQWIKDVKSIVDRKLKDFTPEEYPLNAIFFTNFSYHYQTENEAEQGEVYGVVIEHPKFPPPNPEFFKYLRGALSHYGLVPAIDIDKPIKPTNQKSAKK